MKNVYYDGTKLLSLLDINGNKPELYISTSNRTAGKTTYFNRYFVNCYIKRKEKFMLIYRYNNELSDISDKFFKDIQNLFFPDYSMSEKSKYQKAYIELFLNGDSCGYAVALNSAEKIKKLSHLFSDVQRILFDEFQSETNNYCPNEVKKFLSIHTSVARGKGEQKRYVPVYMLGNLVSTINPYYIEMGISSRLKPDTKFLKGNGFVLEQGYNETASKAMLDSGIAKAFSGNSYIDYSANSTYLNDNNNFIVPFISGNNRYIATIKFNEKEYAVREYSEKGVLYCDYSIDYTFPVRIVLNADDMDINYVMLKNNDLIISNLKYFFMHGAFRFKDLNCKDAIIKIISLK